MPCGQRCKEIIDARMMVFCGRAIEAEVRKQLDANTLTALASLNLAYLNRVMEVAPELTSGLLDPEESTIDITGTTPWIALRGIRAASLGQLTADQLRDLGALDRKTLEAAALIVPKLTDGLLDFTGLDDLDGAA